MAGWIVRPDIGALPNGLAGMPYVGFAFDNYLGFSPNYTGGQPYSYAIAGGSLPPGLTFNKPPGIYSNIGDPVTTLILGGTPTAGVASGSYSFSILWTNGAEERTQLSNYTIFISPAPSLGTCESQLVNGVNFALDDPPGTLQYFIGATAITGLLPISNASTIGSIQASIDADATYLASGTTITVLTGLPSVTVLIAKNSTQQISNMAVGMFIGASFSSTDSEPFVCTLPKKKKKGRRPGVNPYIYFPIDTNFNSVPSSNERWIITCSNSPAGNLGGGGGSVCCYASTEDGSIHTAVQCASYRKSDQQHIDLATAQFNSINRKVPAIVNYRGMLYSFDTVVSSIPGKFPNLYRYKIKAKAN